MERAWLVTLEAARNAFYNQHPEQSTSGMFWVALVDDLGLGDRLSDEDRREGEAWIPRRTNCPLLEAAVLELIESAPTRWRGPAERIFAGRTRNAEVDSCARRTKSGASFIEIYYQFSIVLHDFVDAFDDWRRTSAHFHSAVMSRVQEEQLVALEVRLHLSWLGLEQARDSWLDISAIHQSAQSFLRPADRTSVRALAVSTCEAFLLGHEFTHHLAGHSRKSSGKKYRQEAAAILSEVRTDEAFQVATAATTPEQADEITCDITSFLLLAGYFRDRVTSSSICTALIAAVITLTAMGHIGRSWTVDDPQSDHPGVLTRLAALEAVAMHLTRVHVGPVSERSQMHPAGLMELLRGFWGYARALSLGTESPNRDRVPNFREHFIGMIERTPQPTPETTTDASRG